MATANSIQTFGHAGRGIDVVACPAELPSGCPATAWPYFLPGGPLFMSWIKSDVDIWENPKLRKLRDITGISIIELVGHLHSLWHFTLRNAWQDGDLEPWGDNGIEEAARWGNDVGILVKALRESQFLDGFVIHDWKKIAERYIHGRKSYMKKNKIANHKRHIKSAYLSTQILSKDSPKHLDSVGRKSRVEESRVENILSMDKPRYTDTFHFFMDRVLKDFCSIDMGNPMAVSAAYRRFGRAGKDILAFAGGDPEKAYNGVDKVGAYMQSKGLTWSLDTAAKWLPDALNGGLNAEKTRE